MTAALCQALPSFYSDYNKKLIFCFQRILRKKKQDYGVSTHDFFCSLEICKFHLILIGTTFGQILQRLDQYQSIFQEIDCLYTLYKHGFYSSIVKSSEKVFNQYPALFTMERSYKKHQEYQKHDSFGKSSKNIL